jgi:hypothetical protein
MLKGAIVLMENKSSSFFPKAIRFFTKRIANRYGVKTYTHAMFITANFLDELSVQSSEFAQCIMPLKKFNTDKFSYDVFLIIDEIPEASLDDILKEMYLISAGEPYGFLQNLWFIYRDIVETIFKLDVRKQKNWFPNGDNCSESTYRYLRKRIIANIRATDKNKSIYQQILRFLDEWTENTVHPVDLAHIIEEYPSLFSKVYSFNY